MKDRYYHKENMKKTKKISEIKKYKFSRFVQSAIVNIELIAILTQYCEWFLALEQQTMALICVSRDVVVVCVVVIYCVKLLKVMHMYRRVKDPLFRLDTLALRTNRICIMPQHNISILTHNTHICCAYELGY